MRESRVKSTFPGPVQGEAGWPEGVVARYLSVGGATVDLTIHYTLAKPPQAYATAAACTGCPASKTVNHYRTRYSASGFGSVEEHDPEMADDEARAWAQSHAETCRAMPRPEGGGRS